MHARSRAPSLTSRNYLSPVRRLALSRCFRLASPQARTCSYDCSPPLVLLTDCPCSAFRNNMFPCVVALVSSSLLAVQLFDLLSVLGDYDSFATMITSDPFQLQPSANSVFAVSSFIVISIFTIVLISSAAPPRRRSAQYYPLPVPAPDDINSFSCFPASEKATSKPISHHTAEEVLSPPSIDAAEFQNSSLPPLAESFSEVTYTFGTDRPEVYLKMCELQDMNTICHCPCNHKRADLRKYPHINRLMSSLSPSTAPSSQSESDPEVDFDHMNHFSYTTLHAGNTPAQSCHVIDMESLPKARAPSLEEVVCVPSVQSNVCHLSFPPQNEVYVQTPLATHHAISQPFR
eukprot:TRINITY_DN1194_c0_g1_i3.p1 TRINITY_DN1194_c0_g1~~TRINITY_DN1194_c0_g1_i3.p1  ORF type:complete len:347 (+),score=38.13 TRINITY_DN1194_c0_g1_i3:122-1162(+)